MLKIKDDVDLKELEKYGFYYYDSPRSSFYGCWDKTNSHGTIFINNAKIISLCANNQKTIFELTDTLYDLIQARISRESKGVEYARRRDNKI